MTAESESQVVLPLNEGFVDDVIQDIAGGAVIESRNTRLTVNKGTLARRPRLTPVATITSGTGNCGGIIPGCGGSCLASFKPGRGSRRVANDSAEILVGLSDLTTPTNYPGQNAWYPYQIKESGTVFSASGLYTPAVCIDENGARWFAENSKDINGSVVRVTVLGSDGTLLVSPRSVVKITATIGAFDNFWIGLTVRTGGVVLWYANETEIRAVTLARDGLGLTVGTDTLITTPLTDGTSLPGGDVTSDGTGTAYLLVRDSSVNTTAQVFKVDQSALTSTTLALTTVVAGSSLSSMSIQYWTLPGGTGQLGVVISDNTLGSTAIRLITPSTMTVTASQSIGSYGFADLQPFTVWGVSHVCVAITYPATSLAFSNTTYTELRSYNASSMSLVGTVTAYWYQLQGRGGYHRISDDETYPYFPMVPSWIQTASTLYGPSASHYVTDPAVELMTLHSPYDGKPTIAARYGVDKADLFMYHVNPLYSAAQATAKCVHVAGDELLATYVAMGAEMVDVNVANSTGYANHVVIDLNPVHQPSYAHDAGGPATVAAAYPTVWDGAEILDVGQPHRPLVLLSAAGGTGDTLSGDFSLIAVVSWMDAGGNIHRSMPSLPASITMAGTEMMAFVTLPHVLRNGSTQPDCKVSIYMTEAGGSIYYEMPRKQNYLATNGWYVFESIDAVEPSNTRLYSTGASNEPLLATCPPPAWDVATVGNRQWMIDAEFRNRLVPSKLKEEGIGFEFDPTLAVWVDAQYGKLMKVVDVGGRAVVLAERGIWAITGYGPDNSGGGQPFGEPALVSTIGCQHRHTAVVVPGVGVLFQAADGRFALMSGASVERFETVRVYECEAPTVHLAECEVVYPISGTTESIVFNWQVKGWTKWDNSRGAQLSSVAYVPLADGVTRSYWYDQVNAEVASMDSDDADDESGEMVVTRGWVAPAAPQGDCVFREAWVQLQYPENWRHGLTVSCYYDYKDVDPVSREWSADELDDLAVDGRVTVGVNLHARSARATKVVLGDTITPFLEGETEEATDYMKPLHVTLTFGASNGNRRRSLRANALK